MSPTSFDIGFSLNPCPRKLRAPQPLQRAAVGVLLITHTRKMAPEGNPLDTVSGSRQVTAAPRMVLEVQDHGVHQTKGNLGGKGRAIAFDIETAVLKTDGGDIETPRMVWLDSQPSPLKVPTDTGPSVDDVVDLLTGNGAPPQPTQTKIRELFNVQTKAARIHLERVLGTAVKAGRLTMTTEKIHHRDRSVYRPANGAGG